MVRDDVMRCDETLRARNFHVARDRYELMAGECQGERFPIWIPARIMMVAALRDMALRADPVFMNLRMSDVVSRVIRNQRCNREIGNRMMKIKIFIKCGFLSEFGSFF
ncbi:hypothetical protein [Burkholderia ubonensis]|uniref:hypothetical protein n=1 Tax=Burkholderia ubonensis TaxID=101571 RepID=UPI0012FC55EA|nr:hypothetical protein [Burkholderia ubonensis]